MSRASYLTSHEWHLKNTPVVASVPVTFDTPIPVKIDIEIEYLSLIYNETRRHEYVYEGFLKGYKDLTGDDIRPCVHLAIGAHADGEEPIEEFFGPYFSAFSGDFETTSFIEHWWIDSVAQADIDHTSGGFNLDATVNATYAESAQIRVYECNMPITMLNALVPSPESPDVPTAYYTRATWMEVTVDEYPVYYKIVNWADTVPEGSDFYFLCQYGTSTWVSDNQPSVGEPMGWEGYRGLLTAGSVTIQPIVGTFDSKLVYKVNKTDPVFFQLEKTTDGNTWEECEELPDYFYRKRNNELGTFTYALTEDYINPIDPFDPDAPGPGPDNPTPGDDDDDEDWGDVYTQNFFTQQYMISVGGLQEISNALYDTGAGHIWEDIKKGVEMFGDNPMNSVVNLMYYPLDMSTVFTSAGVVSDVWFGGYQFNMQSHSAYKIVYPNGFFYCGGTTIRPAYKDTKFEWMDVYATRIFVDLPYCGRYELDPARYYGKNIKVIYYIDTRTGSCVACLVNGSGSDRVGHCMDSYNGQIGTQIPITLTDFNAFANAQIGTLLGNGGQAMVSGGQQVSMASNALAAGSAAGVAGAAIGAGALGAIQGAKTVYGVMQNNVNRFNQTRGGSTAMINQYLNQKPRIIFEYQDLDIPNNFHQMNGGPSNYSGSISSFTGYLEVDQVKLQMPGATQSEKEKARALLMGGVYI